MQLRMGGRALISEGTKKGVSKKSSIAVLIKTLFKFTRPLKLQNVIEIEFMSIQPGAGGLISGVNGHISGWGLMSRRLRYRPFALVDHVINFR